MGSNRHHGLRSFADPWFLIDAGYSQQWLTLLILSNRIKQYILQLHIMY